MHVSEELFLVIFSVGDTVSCMFFCLIFNLGVSVLLAELQIMLDCFSTFK